MSEINEIEAAAQAHKRGREAGDATQRRQAAETAGEEGWPVSPLQIGLGIGSAALAAAVLYVGKKRR